MIDAPIQLKVDSLSKSYGVIQAIKNVSFEVKRGEVIGFLGPNGAGKSTTMRIISGLTQATSGKATVCGIPVAKNPAGVKKRIGYMPENNPLPEEMRVKEYLRFRAKMKGVRGREVKKRVDEVMELCDLHRKAQKRIIGTLSKGFRQRVGVADALVSNPELVILDEPTIGLDPHQIQIMRQLLAELKGQITFLLSSHILPEIEMSCDRVIIINQGTIVAQGKPSELRHDFIPATAYRIDVTGNPEKWVDAFKAAPFEIYQVEYLPEAANGYRRYFIECAHDAELPDFLMRHLAKNKDLRIHELAHIDASLEDIFMAATRRTWDETLGENKPYLSSLIAGRERGTVITLKESTQ